MASFLRVPAGLAALGLAAAVAFAEGPQAAGAAGPTIPAAASAIRAFLEASGSPQPVCATPEGRALWQAVQAFYAARGDRPAWVDGDRLGAAGERLVSALRQAGEDGLDADRHDPALVGGRPGDAAAWDVGLTAALALYAADLEQGAVDARPVSVLWRLRARVFDALPVLRAAAETGRPDGALDALRPTHPQYAALRDARRRYAALAAAEASVPALPAGIRIRRGARSPQVPALRARLRFWGDLEPGEAAAERDLFDPALARALARFQARHGITADGGLGPETVAALDTPVRERLRQIALNLERWRWQDRLGGGRSILVNIPTFELHAYDGAREALRMRVVTGKPDSATPVFVQPMTAVVFSPYWNVPGNIALDETMPAVLRDRGYLRRMNLEVLRGDTVVDPARVEWRHGAAGLAFRQRPGAGNSLGLVKFLLPNPFNVYLHDTPERALFARATRALSHGCVRLEKPEALARWVLSDRPEWTAERIAAAMHAGRESAVPLADPIPVSIGYFTAWVDEDGTVEFRPDVYRHDAAQSALLGRPPSAGPADAVTTLASLP